eukprot:scaffold146666_cov65-Attheya_sp.AAC.3
MFLLMSIVAWWGGAGATLAAAPVMASVAGNGVHHADIPLLLFTIGYWNFSCQTKDNMGMNQSSHVYSCSTRLYCCLYERGMTAAKNGAMVQVRP